MIKLRNVTKSYRTQNGRKYVLRNVSLRIPEGRNVGIVGRNGAGKSTLMRILGGIDYPDSGEVVIRKRISWPLALTGGFQGSLSGRDNVKFVCHIYGSSEEEVSRRVAFIHEFSELGDYFDMPIKTYSSGMRSRLAFALSMAFEFDIYLIDEITAVGDRGFRQKSRDAFEKLRSRASFIMVSHELKALACDCDMGLYIRQGEVRLFDDINDAIKAYEQNG